MSTPLITAILNVGEAPLLTSHLSIDSPPLITVTADLPPGFLVDDIAVIVFNEAGVQNVLVSNGAGNFDCVDELGAPFELLVVSEQVPCVDEENNPTFLETVEP
ncbi:MAG: hypothetical protein GY719_23665 [bacterium]|nr:hypothetical protein [bacterium]